jgi:hypothetical protein
LLFATLASHAQSFTLLHSFTGAGDGGSPEAGLTIDRAGNFYGVAGDGGAGCNCGTAFKLTRRGSSWTLTPIYTFLGDSDGRDPQANLVFGPNGSLYGTTNEGGGELLVRIAMRHGIQPATAGDVPIFCYSAVDGDGSVSLRRRR